MTTKRKYFLKASKKSLKPGTHQKTPLYLERRKREREMLKST